MEGLIRPQNQHSFPFLIDSMNESFFFSSVGIFKALTPISSSLATASVEGAKSTYENGKYHYWEYYRLNKISWKLSSSLFFVPASKNASEIASETMWMGRKEGLH